MKLLHIDSSILGDNSASRQLSREVVEAWKAADPSVEVVYRDLAADAIAHVSAATLVMADANAVITLSCNHRVCAVAAQQDLDISVNITLCIAR